MTPSGANANRDDRRPRARPRRRRGVAPRRDPRRRPRTRRARDLRAAPLFRGLPRRPGPRGTTGHHGEDLRDLPRRLPDVRLRGDRGRLRRRRSPSRSASSGASCTAASGSRATPSTSTCCTPPTSSAAATPSSSPALNPAAVERGLRIKKLGNHLMETVGGRAIHPVNVRLGGFYRAPEPRGDRRAHRAAADGPRGVARDDRAGSPASTSPTSSRTTASSRFRTRTTTRSRRAVSCPPTGSTPRRRSSPTSPSRSTSPRSSALHARLRGRDPYLTGPLARYALNEAKLPQAARDAAAAGGPRSGVHEPVQEHHRAGRRALLRLRRGAPARDRVRAARAAGRPGPAAGPRRRRGDRGPAGHAPAALRARRRRDDPVGAHHAPHLAEPAHDRVRRPPGRRVRPRPERRRADGRAASSPFATTTRASRAPPTSSTCRSTARDRDASSSPGSATTSATTTVRGRRSPGSSPPRPGRSTSARSASPSTSSAAGRPRSSPSSSTRPAPAPRRARCASSTSATIRARRPSPSTHAIGLDRVVRLAQVLGARPDRVVVVGIEGEDFSDGTGLSAAVEDAVAHAARRHRRPHRRES